MCLTDTTKKLTSIANDLDRGQISHLKTEGNYRRERIPFRDSILNEGHSLRAEVFALHDGCVC